MPSTCFGSVLLRFDDDDALLRVDVFLLVAVRLGFESVAVRRDAEPSISETGISSWATSTDQFGQQRGQELLHPLLLAKDVSREPAVCLSPTAVASESITV